MQIRLTDEQARALRRVAASREMSVAAVIREVLDQALIPAHSPTQERVPVQPSGG